MKTPGFWENLPLCKDAMLLWQSCEIYDPTFLTALPNIKGLDDVIKKEKSNWIEKYLEIDIPVIYCLRSEKKLYAKNNILLDDNKTNIEEWNDASGIGILHTSVEDSIRKLNVILGPY